MSYNDRQEYNRRILKIMSEYVEKYPDVRFQQMLQNMNVIKTKPKMVDGEMCGIEIIDSYNEESYTTLMNIHFPED